MVVKDIGRSGDVISGAVLAALGVYIFTQSRAWDYYTPDGPGPGFFPSWYGALMAALSLLLIWNALRNVQQDWKREMECQRSHAGSDGGRRCPRGGARIPSHVSIPAERS